MIEGSSDLVGSRFRDFLSRSPSHASEKGPTPSPKPIILDDVISNFHHFVTPTLSHLMVLLTHSSGYFPPQKTGLMVIDCISSLFAAAFPKVNEAFDHKQISERRKTDGAQWAASRRWVMLGDVISSLSKLAAMQNMAILLTSQAITKITAETGAILHPPLSSSAWESGLSTRIALFRDWAFKPSEGPYNREYISGVRFAGVQKAAGVSYAGAGKLVPFIIQQVCRTHPPTHQHNLSEQFPLMDKISMDFNTSKSNHQIPSVIDLNRRF